MKFRAHINIMPRPELLDPQGKATTLGLHNLGFETMDNLRIGKRIALEVEANTKTEAEAKPGKNYVPWLFKSATLETRI